MIRRPPRSTLFPTRRSSDLWRHEFHCFAHAATVRRLERPQVVLGRRKYLTDRGQRFKVEQRIADRKSTRLNSSHSSISYAVFCLKKKKKTNIINYNTNNTNN